MSEELDYEKMVEGGAFELAEMLEDKGEWKLWQADKDKLGCLAGISARAGIEDYTKAMKVIIKYIQDNHMPEITAKHYFGYRKDFNKGIKKETNAEQLYNQLKTAGRNEV